MTTTAAEVTHTPTMAEQDVFLRWLTMVQDNKFVWDKEAYGHKTSFGTIFDKLGSITYTYCLGNSFADVTIHADKENPDDKGGRFYMYVERHRGIQVFYRNGEEEFDITGMMPDNFQVYDLQKLVDFVKRLVE
jgi:hypothetical protein